MAEKSHSLTQADNPEECRGFNLPKAIGFDLPGYIHENWFHWSDTLAINQTQAIQLERDTTEQTKSPLWSKEREHRITTSSFAEIFYRKVPVTPAFLKKICGPQMFKATTNSYGNYNEEAAKKRYVEKTGNHVHPCGLIVHPSLPFLGSSPDGKVCCKREGSGLLEIKCPYKYRDMTIAEAASDYRSFCLERGRDGKLSLKRHHKYYCQIQGQMMLAGLRFCDFVVYTQRDIYIERIYADYPFVLEMISRLTRFYINFVKNYGN